MSLKSLLTHLHLTPQSLFGRFLLMIVLPLLLTQGVVVYVFYERHWSNVSRHLQSALVGEIILIARSAHSLSDPLRSQMLETASNELYLQITFEPGASLNTLSYSRLSPALRELRNHLSNKLGVPFRLTVDAKDDIVISLQMGDGLIHINASRKRLETSSIQIFMLWTLGAAFVLAVIAILFMRNQVRSIAALAQAADQFGHGLDMPGFKPSGAMEVRKAGIAFLEMKERIRRQVQQHTEMLAGISHDLKTPITRMRLQLAVMKKTKDIKALEDDVQDMEQMAQGYLDFARGGEEERAEEIKLADFLRGITSRYRDDHHRITVNIPRGTVIYAQPLAFQRVIVNLINNALRYAATLEISAKSTDRTILIQLDDDGPGIPPGKREDVFRAFYRLDASRNTATGGVGLGLTVAQGIVRRRGGDIRLEESPLKGLRVTLEMPYNEGREGV